MKLINIGFGSMLAAQRVLAMVEPDSAPIKRIVQEAKERGMLIDASYGRKTQSVILMDTDHVILSALDAQALCERWEKEEEKALVSPKQDITRRLFGRRQDLYDKGYLFSYKSN
jgi:regulator of extracellular matrix RemA (YlzA/DUF370 family)